MQELIELINTRHYLSNFVIRDKAIKLLEKEKEQIIKTARDVDSVNFWAEYEGFEEYYNQNYNQNKLFTYCQREIEGQSICDKQCEHCKEYYAPLENQNK